tara:strand:+ start:77 stop:559 length:483 start_codon:yes stop_codon:yes gene_type:complete
MNILNTHNHRLVFCLDGDAPEKYIEKWNKLKIKCESGDNENIIEQIKKYSKLQINKNLPYLVRTEGGLGGDNNLINKQIRFRHIYIKKQFNGTNIPYFKFDNNIIFNDIISTDNEKWNYNQLDDLIYSFIKTANNIIGTNCVSGYIEIRNNISFTDNYLD